MGYEAVQLLKKGESNRVIVIKDDKIVNYDIYEALNMKRVVNTEVYNIAHEISI
jgi:6-phosphofructokinase 1